MRRELDPLRHQPHGHLFENKYSEQGTGLRMRPSEYWRRQGFSTFQEEFYAGDIAHVIGVDNMLWGSDYPHGDGVWPESQRIIQRDLGKLAEPVLRKIICENSGKLYGFIK